VWNVPIDHKIFEEINQAQWLWYMHNFIKDQEEEFNLSRDFIEYHASFIEPQAVQKIRDGRKKSVEIDDTEFETSIKNIFGRALPNAKVPVGEDNKSHSVNMGEIMKAVDEHKNKEKNKDPTFNYKHWSQFDLG
jgi:hypothetical protein